MPSTPAKPIFVVGSPRSGTSVLTWCLGQHPNIFPVPESNWTGEFALGVAKSYQIGCRVRQSFDILKRARHRACGLLRKFRSKHQRFDSGSSKCARTKAETRFNLLEDPRGSWPRKAMGGWDATDLRTYFRGLRKPSPDALLFTSGSGMWDAVVRSLLNFHRLSGIRLVANEEDA